MKKRKMEAVLFILLMTIMVVTAFPAVNEANATSQTTGGVDQISLTPTTVQHSDQSKKEKQFFWEVTKNPSEDINISVIKEDKVDGNHPNLTEKITHEEIDSSSAVSQQSKRVKKILPPYQSDAAKRNDSTSRIVKKHDLPLRPAVVEELTVTEIRHSSIPSVEIGKRIEKEFEDTKTKKLTLKPHKIKNDGNEKRIFNKYPNNVAGKNTSILETPIQDIKKQSFSSTQNENSPSRFDAAPVVDLSVSGDSSERTKAIEGVSVAAPVPDADLTSSPIPTITDSGSSQIQGIQLVPDRTETPALTPRTMWNLIEEQQAFLAREKSLQEPVALPLRGRDKTRDRSFDTDNDEAEYEAENFQPPFSNIEKHELPFSYALPWIQAKDAEFTSREKETDKKNEAKDGVLHPSHFAAVSSDEELRIPADMSKLLQLSELPELGDDVALRVVESGATDNEPQGRTKWYLLLLTGNSTIVQRRRDDFTKYLRLNLAARLSVEYDDVKVNKLILAPPRVLVNVSVYAPSDDIAEESQLDLKERLQEKGEGPLHKLAENNATLLELSGEEYRVVRFLSLQAPQIILPKVAPPAAQAQRDEPHLASIPSHHEDIEFVIYTFLGSACACAVILTLFLALNKYFKKLKEWEWPWKRVKVEVAQRFPEETDSHCSLSPAVIYSGGFPQIRGSWMNKGCPPPAAPIQKSVASAPLVPRYPGIELSNSEPASPRNNKLRMYNCQPDRVLVRKLPESTPESKGYGKTGQDNLSYSNN